MATSSSSTINITGLSTGIDSKAIITALVSSRKAPIDAMKTRESVLNSQKSTFSTVQSQAQALATLADGLKNMSDVSAKAATSSSSAVSVAVSGSAQAGSFDVSVQQLASSFKTYSNGVAARDQAGLFGTGTITLTDGSGSPITLTVDETTTLDSLGEQIREADDNLTVGIVFDGSQYRMQIASTLTGTANDVQLTEDGTTLGFMDTDNLRSRGGDAKFEVDGIAMTRASNTVDDALAGVTFALGAVTTTPTTVTIGSDTETIKSKIQNLVTDYNAIVNTVSTQTKWGGTSDLTKLTGDQTLLGLQRSLASVIGRSSETATTFSNLSSIGISTKKDGTLTLDATKLAAALKKDANAVAKMIADDKTTGKKGLASAIAVVAHAYGDSTGLVQARISGIDNQNRSTDRKIALAQAGVDAFQAQLEAKYAALESAVSQWKNYASAITNAIGKTSNNDT